MNNRTQPTRRPPARRQKKVNKTGRLLLVMVIASLILVGIICLAGYIMGYRYVKVETNDGTLKYFGTVSTDGTLKKGTIYFFYCIRAKVGGKNSTITYTNGDKYSGGLSKLQKSCKGILRYKSR